MKYIDNIDNWIYCVVTSWSCEIEIEAEGPLVVRAWFARHSLTNALIYCHHQICFNPGISLLVCGRIDVWHIGQHSLSLSLSLSTRAIYSRNVFALVISYSCSISHYALSLRASHSSSAYYL